MKMRNNTNNKQPYDDFSERIRQELENHRMPVDGDCWDEIEKRMKSKNRKIGWSAGAAVAATAILLLLFISYPLKETKLNDSNVTLENTVPNTEEKTNNKPITDNYSDKKLAKENKQASVKQPKTVLNEVVLSNNKIEDSNTISEKIEEMYIHVYEDEEKIVEEVQEKKDLDPTIKRKEEKTLLDMEPNNMLLSGRKKNDKWLLAAAVGSGGNLPVSNSSLDYAYNSDMGSIVSPPPNLESNLSLLSPSDFSDISHSAPLSFGVMVRKNLSQHIGLESGLVYTYLSSDFEEYATVRHTAKLNLHYIGVPVNVVGYLWNTPKWNLYLTAGVMVEKGLISVYDQNVYQNDKVLETSVRTSIDGLQWSLNASTGISYRFYQNWSLYFEPRISYYFDNNQPISIRTENPVVIGINTGFRYEF